MSVIEANELVGSWEINESKSAALERINGRQVWKVSLSQEADNTAVVVDVYVAKTGEIISISK